MTDFIIHLDDYGRTLKGMKNEEVGELIKAIISHIEGIEPEITSPTVQAVYPIMSGRVDRDIAYRKKASEFGKLGGAPIGNSNAKTRVDKGNTRVKQGSDKGKQTPNPNPNPNPINKTIVEILAYLNEKMGTHYGESKETTRLINGRLGEGFTLDDFKKVIDKKVKEWKGTEQAQYIRPSTLFAPSHFEEYLNAPEKTTPKISGVYARNEFNRYTQRSDSDYNYDKLIKN